MNPYSEDELVVSKPEYKFVLVNDQTGERITELDMVFVRDDGLDDLPRYDDCPDVYSSEGAYAEALDFLGYSVKVVKA